MRTMPNTPGSPASTPHVLTTEVHLDTSSVQAQLALIERRMDVLLAKASQLPTLDAETSAVVQLTTAEELLGVLERLDERGLEMEGATRAAEEFAERAAARYVEATEARATCAPQA